MVVDTNKIKVNRKKISHEHINGTHNFWYLLAIEYWYRFTLLWMRRRWWRNFYTLLFGLKSQALPHTSKWDFCLFVVVLHQQRWFWSDTLNFLNTTDRDIFNAHLNLFVAHTGPKIYWKIIDRKDGTDQTVSKWLFIQMVIYF